MSARELVLTVRKRGSRWDDQMVVSGTRQRCGRNSALVGIEIGRIGGRPKQMQFAVESFDEFADLGAAVHRMTVASGLSSA